MADQKAAKPAPLHTDSLSYAQRINDGKIPAGWSEAVDEKVAQANVIAAIAWSAVKDAADPQFPACSFAHREKLIAEVEAILKSGAPQPDAASPFTDAACALIAEIRAAHNRADQLRLTDETLEGDN